jgi:type I restriction enzyme M protein
MSRQQANKRGTSVKDRLDPTAASDGVSLESLLWKAANMLHWRVSKAQFRDYLFPLLFMKRISDVYDEERAEALRASNGDESYANLPEIHRFVIPSGAHWTDLRSARADVGAAIVHAMSEIERANPDRLAGIFGDAEWTNKEVLTDGHLSALVEHFSSIKLSNASTPGDVLGRAYEFLLKQFADLSKRKKAGEFYTPRAVIRLMVNILDPSPGETVYDPACGTGGMLLEALNHIRDDRGGKGGALAGVLFGQEKELATSAIARMNLFLHGVEDFSIVRGDTLNHPGHQVANALRQFDCVLANPPFSLQDWGAPAFAADPWGRNKYGTPPVKNGDYAWIQHMIASMRSETGRVAVVLPDGVLSRGNAEGKIRNALLEADLIEAVIKFGPGLFYGTSLDPVVMVIRAKKTPEHKKKILFIDASEIYTAKSANNFLSTEQADEIFALYCGFEDKPHLTRVATLEDVRAEGGILTVQRYVERAANGEQISYDAARAQLMTVLDEHEAAASALELLLRNRGLIGTGDQL